MGVTRVGKLLLKGNKIIKTFTKNREKMSIYKTNQNFNSWESIVKSTFRAKYTKDTSLSESSVTSLSNHCQANVKGLINYGKKLLDTKLVDKIEDAFDKTPIELNKDNQKLDNPNTSIHRIKFSDSQQKGVIGDVMCLTDEVTEEDIYVPMIKEVKGKMAYGVTRFSNGVDIFKGRPWLLYILGCNVYEAYLNRKETNVLTKHTVIKKWLKWMVFTPEHLKNQTIAGFSKIEKFGMALSSARSMDPLLLLKLSLGEYVTAKMNEHIKWSSTHNPMKGWFMLFQLNNADEGWSVFENVARWVLYILKDVKGVDMGIVKSTTNKWDKDMFIRAEPHGSTKGSTMFRGTLLSNPIDFKAQLTNTPN